MNKYTIDHIHTEIICTKKFYEAATNPDNDECAELLGLRETFSGYTITIREIAKSGNKRTANKNLTYANMVRYIASQPNARDNLLEFAKTRGLADQKGHSYAAVKDWFLKQFPAYIVPGVSDKEKENADHFISLETAREILEEISNCETLDEVRDVLDTHLQKSTKKPVPLDKEVA